MPTGHRLSCNIWNEWLRKEGMGKKKAMFKRGLKRELDDPCKNSAWRIGAFSHNLDFASQCLPGPLPYFLIE
jgi:hypothetical protein